MSGYVRIIGGKWRGKKLAVPAVQALRPTPDRVRETVFNWLAPHIMNARCLDLFAGTGALGLEALSRGAAHLTLIDQHDSVIKTLKTHIHELHADHEVTLQQALLPGALQTLQAVFNIVFIDPPFASGLLLPVCFALEKQQLLADHSYIYLEASDSISDQVLPANWTIIKAKKAGMVRYYLVKREKDHDSTCC